MSVQLCITPPAVISPDALPIKKAGTYIDCDFVLNIGLFFDGTGNNRIMDLPFDRQSNVARLFDAYREDAERGFFRHYIEGVGTPCELTNDDGEELFGRSAGSGGKARIILGLLHVLNSVHYFVNNQTPMFEDEQIRALCSGEHVPEEGSTSVTANIGNPLHKQLLRELNLSASLVECSKAIRHQFLMEQANKIRHKLAERSTRPIVVSIYLDVFGFSRGAAAARVFVNWLNRLMMHDRAQLFGVPSYVRMLGLFDTVASVGLSDGVGSDGHWGWAQVEDLHIPPRPVVQNCVHYVALQELRSAFPLDSVYRQGSLPAHCHELIGPGAHSDLGGGYRPGEQGKGVIGRDTTPVGDEGSRLSQFYLNEMYAAALRTCAVHGPESFPWLKVGQEQADGRDMQQQFVCSPNLRAAATTYFAQCGVAADLDVEAAVREHNLAYLAWRYHLTQQNAFDKLVSVTSAWHTDAEGLALYRQGQAILAAQIARLTPDLWKWLRNEKPSGGDHPASGQILTRLQDRHVHPDVAWFFDYWVHDSSAGFIGAFKGNMKLYFMAENQRYLRYRTVYKGDGRKHNAEPSPNYDPNIGASNASRTKWV